MASIASANGVGRGGSGFYDLCDVVSIEKSTVMARTYEEAKRMLKTHGVVAFYPVSSANTHELELYHKNLANMAILMTRLKMTVLKEKKEKKQEGNRGKDRHCLNSFQSSLFEEESYELLREILRPGRTTLHLLQELFPGSSYDTGIGDLVEAQAPSGNAATQWHQDWI